MKNKVQMILMKNLSFYVKFYIW